MPEDRTILFLEELSANAWPAPRRLVYDGWLIGLAGPHTRRANSALPLGPGRLDLAEKLEFCRRFYHQRGRSAQVKLTPASVHAGIDRRLAALGYTVGGGASVQTLYLSGPPGPMDDRVTIAPGLDDAWLAAVSTFNQLTPVQAEAVRGIVGSILPSAGLAKLTIDGRIAAVGLAVAERGRVGLFDLTVDPGRRRQGLAKRLIDSLLSWGREHGAEQAYLQVETGNQPALALYDKLGFQEVYRYWYRGLPPEGD